jgi:DNA-binding MarR family transcriptional regulator
LYAGIVNDHDVPPAGQAPVGDVLPNDLHWCLVRVARGVGAAEHEALKPLGLSLHGYVVLAEVLAGPPRNQLALARSSMIDKSTMVKVLDGLERDRYVVRRVDPADRRARIVEATPSGSDLLRRASTVISEVEQRLLESVSSAEAAAVRTVLRQLALGPFAAKFDPTSAAV